MSQQGFDLQPPPQPPPPIEENKWTPQASTNLFQQPRILEYGPLQGQYGDQFQLNFTLSNSNTLDPNLLKLAFDTFIPTCQLSYNSVNQIFTLHTIVPTSIIFQSSRIPIYLIVQQQNNEVLDSWFINYFILTSILTRKRISDDNNIVDTVDSSIKRSRQQQQQFSPVGGGMINTSSSSSTTNPPNTTTSTTASYYGISPHAPYVGLPPTQPSPRQQREYYEETAAMMGYPTSNPAAAQAAAAAAAAAAAVGYATGTTSFNDPTTSTTTTNYNISQQQPGQDPYGNMMTLMDTQQQQQQQQLSPIQMKPPLPPSLQPLSNTNTTNYPSQQISQAQLQLSQQQPPPPPLTSSSTSPSSTSATTGTTILPLQQGQQQQQVQQPQLLTSSMLTSDPFANLLNKANLNIEGELMTMTQDWTSEEWENQRRLVQFFRRQEGNEVFSNFTTFTFPTEKSKQPDLNKIIVVSCIYYKEKNDYFITSVDCIYLLEHLIGVKFTVEEKNRIRRNLEGYKPLTVSKLKPESADFFKLIMGFPNPKPRNIEKDVKVFPWSILGTALKKIISKYTASYSSTASVNYDVLTTSGGGTSPPA